MQRKVELIGRVGDKFGKEYTLDVESAEEVFRALSSQLSGFKEYISSDDVVLKILVNGRLISGLDDVKMMSRGDIQIVQLETGAGGDIVGAIVGSTIAGALGLLDWVAPLFGVTLTGQLLDGLFKPPKAPKGVTESKDERSYIFNGAVNTIQQGQPVPIGYGRVRIGSQVVSVSVSNTQVPV